MLEIDVANADREALVDARDRLNEGLRRREVLINTERTIREQLSEYKRAVGLSNGKPWQPFTGALASMYAEGEIVVHAGRAWQSQVDNNVWEPGEDADAWQELTADEPTPQPELGEPDESEEAVEDAPVE